MVDRDKCQEGSLIVRVMDQDQKEVDLILVGTPNNTTNTASVDNTNTPLPPTIYSLSLPPRTASFFSNLLQSSPPYSQSTAQYWTCPPNPTLLTIHLTNLTTMYMDYTGCHMAQTVILETIELEDALHWLSTLGGAFSNLGEHNQQFAVRAGTNARKQLVVAMRCGDQSVVIKCWLFIGQSLLQQGQFSEASRVLRMVWRVCHRPPLALLSSTTKLLNMCRGIWARLRHERTKGKREEQCLEVEQKFSVPDNYRSVMENAGAELVSEKTLSDIYLDTQDLALLREDVWLRRRGTLWELKIGAGGRRNTGGMTQYREVDGKEKVQEEVARFTSVGLDKMVEMVRVVAVRESWVLEELSVVIDRMVDDGWSVGEVELVVKSQEEVFGARMKVQETANMLGFTPQKYGKVDHCLGLQNPLAAGVLMEFRRKVAAGVGDDEE